MARRLTIIYNQIGLSTLAASHDFAWFLFNIQKQVTTFGSHAYEIDFFSRSELKKKEEFSGKSICQRTL
jgi:hypothetical protein